MSLVERIQEQHLVAALKETLEKYVNCTDEGERFELELIVSRIREIAGD